MNLNSATSRRFNRTLLSCALAGCMALAAPVAFAQSTAATIRGQVSVDSTPATDARVTATNTATGLTRTVQASSNGAYNLAGLPPGTYRVDVAAGGQNSSQTVTVAVGQTATLNLGVGGVAETAPAGEATDLDAVVVTAPVLTETKTSEIATYVSQKQIEALPQGTRNFLAFADTVPGVQFVQGSDGSTRLRSGAQGTSSINVFIDGVGQKSYSLPGGVGGQDSSRGNPFPQSAIGEYKVITQNYKAEFDQISSAAVVAATRSGTNEFAGDFFWDYTDQNWRAATPNESAPGNEKIKSKEEQYGASLAGPIIQDKLHFFVAYEAKEYATPRDITLGASGRYDLSQIPADLLAQVGTAAAPFKQDMYFGKLSWSLSESSFLEFSAQIRKEDELVGIGGQNLPSYGSSNTNDVSRYDLRYQFSNENWMNDAHITFEDLSWAPRGMSPVPGYLLNVADVSDAGQRVNIGRILNTGGSPNNQDKGQEGWSFQNDLTFFGWEGHTIKMGVKYKDIEVRAIERHYSVPQFHYDINASMSQPYRVEFATGVPGTAEGFSISGNKQYGLYVQDDWEVNEHLTFNLGVRWDYETTPSYEDYVTPAAVASGIREWASTRPNMDYDVENYISDGNNRKASKDAWQPRLGFSYDVNADQRFVVFGGAGRAYDRNLFDRIQLEINRATFARYNAYFFEADGSCMNGTTCIDWDPIYFEPAALQELAQTITIGREWYLNNNDLKVPYSDQFSLGVRNVFSMFGNDWNSEITLSHIKSYDGVVYRLGNRRADGSFYENPEDTSGAPWGFPPPVGTILLVDNLLDSKSNSMLLKLDKPYTVNSGWGVTLAYTYTDAEQNSKVGDRDFPEIFGTRDTSYFGWLPAPGVPEHRFVGTGIWDAPGGIILSAKLTLESQSKRLSENCLGGGNLCYWDGYDPDGTIGFKQFDLAAAKEWDTGSKLKLRVRADVLNVFDWYNWNDYEGFFGNVDTGPNPNLGRRNGLGIRGPTRTFKLSFGIDW